MKVKKHVPGNGHDCQGDLAFLTIHKDRISWGDDWYIVQPPQDKDFHIMSHSESGHHHCLQKEGVVLWKNKKDPFVMRVQTTKKVELFHLKDDVTRHGSWMFDPTPKDHVVCFIRQTEPFEGLLRAVAD